MRDQLNSLHQPHQLHQFHQFHRLQELHQGPNPLPVPWLRTFDPTETWVLTQTCLQSDSHRSRVSMVTGVNIDGHRRSSWVGLVLVPLLGPFQAPTDGN